MTVPIADTFVAEQIGPPHRRYFISRDPPFWTFLFDEMTPQGDWRPGFDTVERWFFEILRYPMEHSSSPLTWRLEATGEVVDLTTLQPALDGKAVGVDETPER